MANSIKIGLDYFPHDSDMFEDPKIKFIKAKHKLLGYGFYCRLLEIIYKEKGYYANFTQKQMVMFADEVGITIEKCQEILIDCLNEDLFDKTLYQKYNILTSKRIQINYLKICEKRKLIQLDKKYLLIDPYKFVTSKFRGNFEINDSEQVFTANEEKQDNSNNLNISDEDFLIQLANNDNKIAENEEINLQNEGINLQRERERESKEERERKEERNYFDLIYHQYLPPEFIDTWRKYIDHLQENGIKITRFNVVSHLKAFKECFLEGIDPPTLLEAFLQSNHKGIYWIKEKLINEKNNSGSVSSRLNYKPNIDIDKIQARVEELKKMGLQ